MKKLFILKLVLTPRFFTDMFIHHSLAKTIHCLWGLISRLQCFWEPSSSCKYFLFCRPRFGYLSSWSMPPLSCINFADKGVIWGVKSKNGTQIWWKHLTLTRVRSTYAMLILMFFAPPTVLENWLHDISWKNKFSRDWENKICNVQCPQTFLQKPVLCGFQGLFSKY